MILLLIVVLFIAVVLFCAWASNRSAASRPAWKREPDYNGRWADDNHVSGDIGDCTAWPEGEPMPHYDREYWANALKEDGTDRVPSQLREDWSKLESELNEVR